ncbi:MAG: response regulator transcription factor [Gaiellaceae bacterium]
MKILLVEDSAPTRDLLQRSLKESGHVVTAAARYATGLRLAREGEFDLAIVDVGLPDGDGMELCRDVRASGIALPILFLTARGEVEDRIAGLDAGGDDYLRKPFALAELRARIRALGRRGRAAPRSRIECAGTTIDFSARRLMRDGNEITLTAREWAVLDVLAASEGRVVSREDVIATAWPRPGQGASESLDVILSRLRRKLGEEGAIRLRTVRGLGLALEVQP